MKTRTSLDNYDIIPEDMRTYMSHYGKHFSKKMYEFAVSNMYKAGNQRIMPVTKEQFENKMRQHGIVIENDFLYDGCYVWSMCAADFLGSSITDELHQAKYVKDLIDDVDAADGQVFNRFYADMCLQGIPINWIEML